MRQAVFFVFATLGYFAYSQNTTPIYIIEGDTLSTPYVGLGEVVVLPQLKFGTYEDYLAYYRLRQRTLKVYPYAMLASKRLTILNERLAHIKGRRAQKRYTKQVERYVEGEFKDELKKLTRAEGRILIKLIHRETGSTAHELIKNLRNGWRAFVYQTTAKMFDINLKTEYKPTDFEEDAMIEGIILRAMNDGTLESLIKKSKKVSLYD